VKTPNARPQALTITDFAVFVILIAELEILAIITLLHVV
jgi:hypothetical protein